MKLSVSTFYLPFNNICQEISALDKAGIDMFHVDFMDGNFVENLGMGIQDLDAVRSCTEKPVDVHMMVQDPDRYVELMAEHGADIIYIHPEACRQPAAVLQHIRRIGRKCGLAVSPSMSIPSVEEMLPLCDYVLVLAVNPGFANQTYLPYAEGKAARLAALGREMGYKTVMDGAIDLNAVKTMSARGVNGFVLGNRVLLEHDLSEYAEQVRTIRATGQEALEK